MSEKTSRDFPEPLLAALFLETKGVPNSLVNLKPVRSRVYDILQIEEGELGNLPGTDIPKARRWVQEAVKKMKKEGYVTTGDPGTRGRWGLTPEGVKYAQQLKHLTNFPPDEGSEESAKVEASAKVFEQATTSEGYLEAVLIDQTPCYAHFSRRSDECGKCYLKQKCAEAQKVVFSTIAYEIREKDGEDSGVSGFLKEIGSRRQKMNENTSGWIEETLGASSPCAICGKDIPRGPCVYKDGKVAHPSCVVP